MNNYKNRLIDDVIIKKLQSTGGIVLRGSRAVGKTTTASYHANSEVHLDASVQTLEQAKIAPESLLIGDAPRLIDEWQLAPNIWNTIRHEIDVRSLPGQFILTGSAAPDDDKIRHTGAGRFSRLTLRPMSLSESGDSLNLVRLESLFFARKIKCGGFGGHTIENYSDLIVRGGWPALVEKNPMSALDAMIDYVDNVAFVDLRTLKSPPDPIRMAALIRAIARNISTEVSLEKLAKEAEIIDDGITAKTVRKYLDQLTQIFILEELPAWKTHLRSSIQMRVKPKWHFVDPSIATAALRVTPKILLSDLNAMGLFFESLVMRDLRIYSDVIDAKVYHYRDSTDLEIDAIIERYDEKWIAVEIKLGGEKAIEEAASNFKKLKKRMTDRRLENLMSCNIITGGENSYTRPDGVNIIALGHLCP